MQKRRAYERDHGKAFSFFGPRCNESNLLAGPSCWQEEMIHVKMQKITRQEWWYGTSSYIPVHFTEKKGTQRLACGRGRPLVVGGKSSLGLKDEK